MNFTTENAIETPANAAPISSILNETDAILCDCLAAIDKLTTCISGMARLEDKPKAEPRCMRDCVMLTADRARLVRSGIMQIMEAIGV